MSHGQVSCGEWLDQFYIHIYNMLIQHAKIIMKSYDLYDYNYDHEWNLCLKIKPQLMKKKHAHIV
jgi:hypothetical protein